MSKRLLAHLRPVSASALVGAPLMLGVALAIGVAVAAANTEHIVERSFLSALKVAGGGASSPRDRALVAGSEAYWLGHGRANAAPGARVEPAAWSAPKRLGVVVGDRITIGSGSSERVLEVVAIADVPASKTQIETGEASGHQLMVTCRDASSRDGGLVRFMIDGESLPPATKSQHSL
jgi:hypothetical protein